MLAAPAAFTPLADTSAIPAEAGSTTNLLAVQVPFVGRVETAAVDRGIFQSAVLHNPVAEAGPMPAAPPKGGNKRLIAIHGFGCTGG